MIQPLRTHRLPDGGRYDQSPVFDAAGAVRHAFTTRLGGASQGVWTSLNLGFRRGDETGAVQENYRRVAAWLGVDPARITATRQVHADTVIRVRPEDAGRGVTRPAGWECDALITDVPGVTLAAFGADCCVLLLCDPRHRAVAAVHAGWRGTARDIAGKAVAAMTAAFGTDPADVLAAFGPSIGPCCFDTHEDVPRALLTALPGELARPYIAPLVGGKFSIDLPSINQALLARAGVPGDNVHQCRVCTSCRGDGLYWSHRRQGNERGVQAALIAWQDGEGPA